MKLNQIIILTFILTAVISSFGANTYYYLNSNQLFENKIRDNLSSTSQAMANQVEFFIEEQKEKMEIAATHQELSNQELREITNKSDEFYELFTIDSNGIIIASTNELHIGQNKSTDQYFVNGRNKTYVTNAYISDADNQKLINISTPHNDGVLVGRIKLEKLSEIVSDYTGLGRTGESYLVNKNYVMITNSRNSKEQTELKQVVNTQNTENCFQDKTDEINHKDTEVFLGYTGVNVLGNHVLIPEMDWCLLTEIEEEEAFGSLRKQVFETSLNTAIAAMALVLIIGFILSAIISKPIKKLTKDVDSITKGKFDTQLKKSRITEVQSLIDSLNRILASLKLAILRTGATKEEIGIGEVIKKKEEAEKKAIMFGDAVKTSIDGISIADLEGKIIFTNNAFNKMWGYEPEEVIGKKLDEFWKEDQIKKVRTKVVPATLKSGWTGKLVGKRKDKSSFDASVTSSVVKDKKGKTSAILGIFREIQKEKKTKLVQHQVYEKWREKGKYKSKQL